LGRAGGGVQGRVGSGVQGGVGAERVTGRVYKTD
jgi:hypothetical protein